MIDRLRPIYADKLKIYVHRHVEICRYEGTVRSRDRNRHRNNNRRIDRGTKQATEPS